MKASVLPLLILTSAGLSSARDFRPRGWMENAAASDSSVQRCYVFRSVPGVAYRIESSHDLTTWATEDEFYGLGHEWVVPMREFTPAPPQEPGSGDPPPMPSTPSLQAGLLFREASGAAPGTVVSWKSLDHGGPMNRFLPLVMTPDWSQMPFFWNTYDDCSFFISRFSGAVPPPASEPPLGTADAAMIACLEEHFAEINAEIDASVAHARNTPPPPPPDPESRKFWRVFCDAGIDTDSDGSPDWAEFEISGTGQGVLESGVRGDAFDADTNGDGIPDGLQLDVDLDGTADAADVGLDDPAASYPIGRLPRYALFEIMNATPPADYPDPLQINDRGEVLYANGVWQAGVWTPLAGHTENSGNVRAIGINDHGEILGIAGGAFTDQNGTTSEDWDKAWNVVHWPDRDSWCAPVIQDGKGAWMGTPYFTYPGDPGNYLSNDGSIIAMSRYLADDHLLVSENYFLWTLAGPGRTAGRTASPLTEGGVWDRDTCWGGVYVDHANGGTTLVPRIRIGDVTLDTPGSVRNVVPDGAGGYVVSFYFDKPTMALRDGQWMASPLLAPAIDIDVGGTAIGRDHEGKSAPTLTNGSWIDITRWAPESPADWASAGTRLLDTTRGGWVLAKREIPNQLESHAVALPIRAEGNYVTEAFPSGDPRHHACGVDDFSIGSFMPGPAVQDRIWIMAPQFSGASTVTFRSPVDPDHPVTLSASGIDLGGGQLIGGLLGGGTPGGQTTDLPISATSPLASGTEVVAEVTMGGQTSLSRPLGFKVMKSRVVKVGLYKVTKTGDSPGAPNLAIEPVSLTKHLNDVFKPQVNVTFQIIPMNDISVDWDVEGGKSGSLDTASRQPSAETQKTLDKAAEQNADVNIHLFVLGGGKWLDSADEGGGGSAGSSLRDDAEDGVVPNACWVVGNDLNGRDSGQLYETIAHEIGHVLVGYGHPDKGSGPAPLPSTSHYHRLMCTSRGTGGLVREKLLVKGEWDKAEDWLANEVDK